MTYRLFLGFFFPAQAKMTRRDYAYAFKNPVLKERERKSEVQVGTGLLRSCVSWDKKNAVLPHIILAAVYQEKIKAILKKKSDKIC